MTWKCGATLAVNNVTDFFYSSVSWAVVPPDICLRPLYVVWTSPSPRSPLPTYCTALHSLPSLDYRYMPFSCTYLSTFSHIILPLPKTTNYCWSLSYLHDVQGVFITYELRPVAAGRSLPVCTQVVVPPPAERFSFVLLLPAPHRQNYFLHAIRSFVCLLAWVSAYWCTLCSCRFSLRSRCAYFVFAASSCSFMTCLSLFPSCVSYCTQYIFFDFQAKRVLCKSIKRPFLRGFVSSEQIAASHKFRYSFICLPFSSSVVSSLISCRCTLL